jgi:DNA-directed RNA polymerase subunit RPC12/RpoP
MAMYKLYESHNQPPRNVYSFEHDPNLNLSYFQLDSNNVLSEVGSTLTVTLISYSALEPVKIHNQIQFVNIPVIYHFHKNRNNLVRHDNMWISWMDFEIHDGPLVTHVSISPVDSTIQNLLSAYQDRINGVARTSISVSVAQDTKLVTLHESPIVYIVRQPLNLEIICDGENKVENVEKIQVAGNATCLAIAQGAQCICEFFHRGQLLDPTKPLFLYGVENDSKITMKSKPLKSPTIEKFTYICCECKQPCSLSKDDLVKCNECGSYILEKPHTSRTCFFQAR